MGPLYPCFNVSITLELGGKWPKRHAKNQKHVQCGPKRIVKYFFNNFYTNHFQHFEFLRVFGKNF